MKIEEMYPAFVKRNQEVIKEMREKFDVVISSFRDAADKIPEDLIFQAISYEWIINQDYEPQDDPPGTSISFWISKRDEKSNKIRFDMGPDENIKGRVPMNYEAIKQLEEFLKARYQRDIYINRLEFYIRTGHVELQFIAELSAKEYNEELTSTCDIFELNLMQAVPEGRIETDDQGGGDDASRIITISFKL